MKLKEKKDRRHKINSTAGGPKLLVIRWAYRIVASRSMSWLVTCLGLFRLLMKGIFGPYVL